jgi:hypothetical protein
MTKHIKTIEADELAQLRSLIRKRLIAALQDPEVKASMVSTAVKFLDAAEAIEDEVEPADPRELLKGLPFPPSRPPALNAKPSPASAADAMTGAMRSIPPKRKPLGDQH